MVKVEKKRSRGGGGLSVPYGEPLVSWVGQSDQTRWSAQLQLIFLANHLAKSSDGYEDQDHKLYCTNQATGWEDRLRNDL